VKDAIYVLGGLAVVVFFIVRQRRSDRFRERSLIFPIALGIYGVVLLTDTSKHHALTVASAALLIVSAVASVGFGVIRGRTIELFTRGGELWERASWTTIAAGWGGLLLTRVALIGIAAAIGARVAASPTSIPLMLAITLGAQMLVVPCQGYGRAHRRLSKSAEGLSAWRSRRALRVLPNDRRAFACSQETSRRVRADRPQPFSVSDETLAETFARLN
jgi:hypothetical protein